VVLELGEASSTGGGHKVGDLTPVGVKEDMDGQRCWTSPVPWRPTFERNTIYRGYLQMCRVTYSTKVPLPPWHQ
jgi:hypothetical protein